ncbi:MAG: D-alanine--D-alanine ligase family protein [Chloroflexota bacterium]|jgi:D-alanine-D-alanine ligase
MTGSTSESKHGGRRIRIGLIFGGRSGEHEVSLMSARSVRAALDPGKYDIVMIGITKSGRWITGDVAAALESGDLENSPSATLLPDPESSKLMELQLEASQPAKLSVVAELDVVFPVLHGPYGEDGTVQGLLELAGIPYVGAGVVGSATGMDKAIFKAVMVAHGIPILPWKLVLASEWREQPNQILNSIEQALSYPVFTKPANLGSSVGIRRCENRRELQAGLNEAAAFDRRLIVEQGINGRELEVSVLGNDQPVASVVGEIKPRRTFYDYVAKYVSDDSELMIPAEISPELSSNIRDIAIRAFRAIDCAGLARADFLLDKDDGSLYINELNTIPGFTRISMYPKLWEASGLSYSQLLDRLVELALERSAEKAKLLTTYQVD